MKLLIFVFILLAVSLQSQTYKVDLGGVANQFPQCIGICNGDLIIATIENINYGYSKDAISIFNLTKNKVVHFSNNNRQTSPTLLIDSDKIITTHWDLTNNGYDIAQVLVLNNDLQILKQSSFDFGGDTQIQSIIKCQNEYLMAGEILIDNLIVKLNDNLDITQSKRFPLSSKGILSFQDLIIKDSSIIAVSDISEKIALSELDFNLNLKKTLSASNSTQYVRIPSNIISLNDNFVVLNDDYNKNYAFLGNSIHLFDNNFNYIKEYKLQVSSQNVLVKQITVISDELYVLGTYINSSKRKSILAIFNKNLKLITSITLNDLEIASNIVFDNKFNNYYIVGLNNCVDNNNGDLFYIKAKNFNNICYVEDIQSITSLLEIGNNYSSNQIDLLTRNTNRSFYNLVSASNTSSTTSEICKPTISYLDFQLLKVDYKSPCSIDSVEIDIVPSSTDINVIWFDGSPLKKRFFTKNGTYKVTLTIPGVKDSTFDISINSIYKGSASGNLTFSPDTLLFSNSDIDKITCQTFTITNVGIDTVTLSELTYMKKLNFTSPNSIFPITLFPKESKDLEVCFFGNNFKSNYTDSIRFDNCNNPKFLTLLADIPEDTLSFATRCMLKFHAGAPIKSIAMNKTQLNELIQELQNDYKLSNLLGLAIYDVTAILPNQLVHLESNSVQLRILILD